MDLNLTWCAFRNDRNVVRYELVADIDNMMALGPDDRSAREEERISEYESSPFAMFGPTREIAWLALVAAERSHPHVELSSFNCAFVREYERALNRGLDSYSAYSHARADAVRVASA